MKRTKIFRISTVSHSLRVTLRGQFKYLKAKGFDYTLICTQDELINNVAIEEEADFLPLVLTRHITPFKDLKSLLLLIKYIKRGRPEIVHTHSPKAGLIGMMAAYFCRVPVRIHTVAGIPLVEKTGLTRNLLILCEKLTYYFAHKVIFNSPSQAAFVTNKKWINKEKTDIIGKGSSNGVNLSYFDSSAVDKMIIGELKEKYGIDKTDFVIGYVGRIAAPKGVNELVIAFKEIIKTCRNAKLLLVGENDLKEPLSLEALEIIKQEKRIIRVEHQKDIRPYILISDIFILPSYREGFPQTIMQACAMESCIVCSDINGCNEMITNEVNGLLIKPKSVDEIVIAIRRLKNDEKLREKFKRNSKTYLEENFNQEEFWKKIEILYKSLLLEHKNT